MAGPKSAERVRATRDSGYTPTVVSLLVLIALEIGAYLALRYAFRTAHGG